MIGMALKAFRIADGFGDKEVAKFLRFAPLSSNVSVRVAVMMTDDDQLRATLLKELGEDIDTAVAYLLEDPEISRIVGRSAVSYSSLTLILRKAFLSEKGSSCFIKS